MTTTQTDAGFEALLEHIKEQRSFDFTGYKRASLQRRIRQRMETLEIATFDGYREHLETHPEEFTALFNTVLINVTGFFRDPDGWELLRERLVPELLDRSRDKPVRIWSAGCASGQEAYSLAMLLADALGMEEFRARVKIYATDIDEEALAQARQASYSATEMSGVSDEQRAAWFEPVGDRFVVRKVLRRAVIFGRNDLVQDAPISHVDILACRNTLMYLNAETQARVLGRLHFALRNDGILFLGKAEMLLSHSAFFRPVDLKRRIFRKVPGETRSRRPATIPFTDGSPAKAEVHESSRLERAAFQSSAAAQIVLDAEGRLALANQRAAHLIGVTGRDVGRPVQDLTISYRPVELRSHIEAAVNEHRPVWVRDVEWERGGETTTFDIQVVPLTDETGTDIGTTVIFNDVTQYRRLQRELQYANSQLETAYEELQSAHEELETTNEELQSTVEELETTNEELQSTNEELETMNDELQYGNEALRDRQERSDQVNNLMSAVLGSLSSGIAVVDHDLKVIAWNARAAELWGVRTEETLGQYLPGLDIGLPVEQLREPLETQLASRAAEPRVVEVDAVNRRGQPVRLRITMTPIHDSATVVVISMDLVATQA